MSIREFIRKNRSELDQSIRAVGHRGKLNDEDREEWILNDEGLYLWAKREGVPV